MHVLDLLEARGFVKQCTDKQALRRALDRGTVTFYVGFDPTGDSLHVGHLLPVMAMAWLQRAGHRPIIVLGGGTGMVGDPSGKDQTREILTVERIQHNLACQRPQFGRFLEVAQPGAAGSPTAAIMIDNGEWLLKLGYVEFLRDIGKHFSVNKMLGAESIRLRLERNQGLSFIEFNYHLLQSYDFELYRRHACTLQMGGDDQWFNILGGVDLIRRETGAEAHALTVPLLLTADAHKMGKTEKGAVWLDAAKLAPFEYYQYWINVHDADVVRFLRLYTFLDDVQIDELARLVGAELREAKRVLALEATALAHGRPAAEQAAEAAKQLFYGAGASGDVPTHPAKLPMKLVDLLVETNLCPSKSAARRLIEQGGVRLGPERASDVDATVSAEVVLWAGKKKAVRVISTA